MNAEKLFDSLVGQPRFHIPAILVVSVLLYFSFLGARDFWDHENDYAEITRVMLMEENYLLPRLNDEVWTEKPILFFWTAAFFSWLAGGVNEWTVRLPAALSATALMWVFYFFITKRVGARTAFLSAIVLATCLLSAHVERHLPANMLFFLLVTLCMFFLAEVLVFGSNKKSHVYGSWFFMGLACLTKGPIAVLSPASRFFYTLFSLVVGKMVSRYVRSPESRSSRF